MRPEFWSALLGGSMIGAASALLLFANGRIAGVSGILGGALAYYDQLQAERRQHGAPGKEGEGDGKGFVAAQGHHAEAVEAEKGGEEEERGEGEQGGGELRDA